MEAVDNAREAGLFRKVCDVIKVATPARWRIGFLQCHYIGVSCIEKKCDFVEVSVSVLFADEKLVQRRIPTVADIQAQYFDGIVWQRVQRLVRLANIYHVGCGQYWFWRNCQQNSHDKDPADEGKLGGMHPMHFTSRTARIDSCVWTHGPGIRA